MLNHIYPLENGSWLCNVIGNQPTTKPKMPKPVARNNKQPASAEEMLHTLEEARAIAPEDPRALAILAAYQVYQGIIKCDRLDKLLGQMPVRHDLQRLGLDYTRMQNERLQRKITKILAQMPRIDDKDNTYGERSAIAMQTRRQILINLRDKLADLAWQEAIRIITDTPEKAIALHRDRPLIMNGGINFAVSKLSGFDKGGDRNVEKILRRTGDLIERLKATGQDIATMTDADAQEQAIASYGGIRILLAPGVATSIVNSALAFANFTFIKQHEQARQVVEEFNTCSTEDMARIVAGFPVWEDMTSYVNIFPSHPVSQWPELATPLIDQHRLLHEHIVSVSQQLAEVGAARRQHRQEIRQHERRTCELERALGKAKEENERLKRQGHAKPPPAPAPEEPAKESSKEGIDRKTIERLQGEIQALGEQNAQLRQLLDAVMPSPSSTIENEGRRLPRTNLRQRRGIIIGGHPGLHAKLRRELPECTYYGAEQKRIDEGSFLERDFVIFFTGYCNHSLADNAMRMCRQHELPAGYTTQTNVSYILKDIANLLGYEGIEG